MKKDKIPAKFWQQEAAEPEHRAIKRKLEKLSKKQSKSRKIPKVMEEYEEGKLHSGSKKGPKVKSRKQAVAIALSEARKSKKRK